MEQVSGRWTSRGCRGRWTHWGCRREPWRVTSVFSSNECLVSCDFAYSDGSPRKPSEDVKITPSEESSFPVCGALILKFSFLTYCFYQVKLNSACSLWWVSFFKASLLNKTLNDWHSSGRSPICVPKLVRRLMRPLKIRTKQKPKSASVAHHSTNGMYRTLNFWLAFLAKGVYIQSSLGMKRRVDSLLLLGWLGFSYLVGYWSQQKEQRASHDVLCASCFWHSFVELRAATGCMFISSQRNFTMWTSHQKLSWLSGWS